MTPYLVILGGFALLSGAMLVLELLGRAARAGLRPLAEQLAAAMAARTGRWLVLAVWLWLGFHFLAR
jgi:hypothetical protein